MIRNLRVLFVMSLVHFCAYANAKTSWLLNATQPSEVTLAADDEGTDDIEALREELRELMEKAKGLLEQSMNKDVLDALSQAYIKAVTLSSDSSADDIKVVIADLKEKMDAAMPSIEIYNNIKSEISEASSCLDESGRKKFNELVKDVIKSYKDGNITDGVEEHYIISDALRVATKAQTSSNTDWTNAIYNPGFEDRNSHWITMAGDDYRPLESVKTSDIPWIFASGKRYAYRKNMGDTPINVSFYQDIDSVPSGMYKIKATVYTNSKTMDFLANEGLFNIKSSSSENIYRTLELTGVNLSKKLRIGVKGVLQPGEEFRMDDIRIEYNNNDIDLRAEAVPDNVNMDPAIREKQNKAIREFEMNPQPALLYEAIKAIGEAKQSAAYYAQMKGFSESMLDDADAPQPDGGENINTNDFGNALQTSVESEVLVNEVSASEISAEANDNGDVVVSYNSSTETLVANTKYYVVFTLDFNARVRTSYLEFGLKGVPTRLSTRISSAEEEYQSLGEYVYNGEEGKTLVYEYSTAEDIKNPVVQMTIKDVGESGCVDVIDGVKGISVVHSDSTTGIKIMRQTTSDAPVGIYTLQGIKVKSLDKGLNIVRMSDGTVKKVMF